jgi:hypothetical protein
MALDTTTDSETSDSLRSNLKLKVNGIDSIWILLHHNTSEPTLSLSLSLFEVREP